MKKFRELVTNPRTMAVAVSSGINAFGYSIVYPLVPLYLHQDRGFPMTTVGLLFPLIGVAGMVSPPFFGWLTDRIGRRPVMQFGQHGRGVVYFLLALAAVMAAPFWVFAALFMITAAIGAAYQIASNSYLADVTKPEERSLHYGRISICTNMGWAFGPMIGASLAGLPFAYLFMLTALLLFAGGVVSFLCCPEPQTHTARKAQQGNFTDLLRSRSLMELFVYNFFLCLLICQLFSTLSVFATGTVKISRQMLGMAYSVNGFTGILLQQPVTLLLNRWKVSAHRRLAAGAGFYALGFGSMAFCTGGVYMLVSVFTLTIGELIFAPGIFAAVSRLAPPGMLGRAMSARILVGSVAYAVGPWFGALLYARWPQSPVLLWSVLAGFGLLACIGFRRMGKPLAG